MTSSVRQSKIATIKARLRIPLLVGLIIVTAGLMAPEISDLINDSTARQWTTVPAEITKVDLPIAVTFKDPYFEPHVEFKYTVDDKQYTGTRLSFGKRSPLLGYDMGLFIQKFEVGKAVNIQVEPGRPDNSVLDPEGNTLVNVFCHFIAVAMFCSLIYLSTYPPVGVSVHKRQVA